MLAANSYQSVPELPTEASKASASVASMIFCPASRNAEAVGAAAAVQPLPSTNTHSKAIKLNRMICFMNLSYLFLTTRDQQTAHANHHQHQYHAGCTLTGFGPFEIFFCFGLGGNLLLGGALLFL